MRRIIKLSFLLLIMCFIGLLSSCGDGYIEVGFEKDNSCLTKNRWIDEFKLGLKCRKSINETQNIDLYYGITRYITNEINIKDYQDYDPFYKSDFNQTIRFSLYRYCRISTSIQVNDDNRILIYSYEDKLEYFLSEYFYFNEIFCTDTINKNDLIAVGNSGVISYKYELTPVNDEYIKLFLVAQSDYIYNNGTEVIEVKKGDLVGPDSPIFRKMFFSSYCSIKYELTDNGIKLG